MFFLWIVNFVFVFFEFCIFNDDLMFFVFCFILFVMLMMQEYGKFFVVLFIVCDVIFNVLFDFVIVVDGDVCVLEVNFVVWILLGFNGGFVGIILLFVYFLWIWLDCYNYVDEFLLMIDEIWMIYEVFV